MEEELKSCDEELLAGLAADFVSEARFANQLKDLLERPPAQWYRIGSVLPVEWGNIHNERLSEPVVAWLSLPDSAHGEGYATILFFEERLHWHTLALVNRRLVVGG